MSLSPVLSMFRAALPVVSIDSPGPEELSTIEKIARQVGEPLKSPVFVFDLGLQLRSVKLVDGGIEFEQAQRFEVDPLIEILDFIAGYGKQAIFILLDLHPFLFGERVVHEASRRVKNLCFSLKNSHTRLILMGAGIKPSSDFHGLIYEVNAGLPSYSELRESINVCVSDLQETYEEMEKDFEVSLSAADRDRLIRASQGLTIEESLNALRMDAISRSRIDAQTVEQISSFKTAKLQRLGVDFAEPADVQVGGVANFKAWVAQRASLFAQQSAQVERKLKLPSPKGVLLVGPSGTGKSLLAKTLGHSWAVPVLSVDMSAILGSLVGESENKLKSILKAAEACAPCVLLLDEVEKMLGGVAGASTDGGVSQRIFGMFLSWMNDKKAPVFVVATANDISQLPQEFSRKGRFDEVFFVDLPNLEERSEILQNHLSRHEQQFSPDELLELATRTEHYCGAELGSLVNEAAILAANEGRDDLKLDDLLSSIEVISPVAASANYQGKVMSLRQWASTSARPASAPVVRQQQPAATESKGRKAKVMI